MRWLVSWFVPSPVPVSPPVPVAAPVSCGELLAEADGFDFPVGPPDGAGYYDAQPFGTNTHLGSDWNGRGGGNTDLGDTVSAVADGLVAEATDAGGGWGRVVRILHRTPDGCVESLYAHLDTFGVEAGALVRRGDPIGTIGDAHGLYLAHLHFELRDAPGRPLGGGYGEPDGQIDPTAYVRAHRPVPVVLSDGR